MSSPKAQKALSIVVQEPRPQPTTPPPPAQKRQTTFSSRQTKRLSSSFLNTPEPQQQLSQQLSQLSVSGVRDKELNLDSQIPSLPYTPSSKRRSYGIFESPVGRSPYGVALRTPRNEDHDSPEQRLKRYGIVGEIMMVMMMMTMNMKMKRHVTIILQWVMLVMMKMKSQDD